ncbi:MAG: hypothetical protein C4547_00370 [Phycisphaerales bacterium]|nr:MAG: hypothetical protein C4547_00370 [Phycisphaerales bacterium]
MTRCLGLIALLGGLALATVVLRAEQARVRSCVVSTYHQRAELRRELWRTQVAIARLCAPDRLHTRVQLLAGGRQGGGSTSTRLASR